MKVNVLFFGTLIDATDGKSEITLEDVRDTEMIEKILFENFPGLKKYTFRLALNKKILESKQFLSDNDVIALLPPFSGG